MYLGIIDVKPLEDFYLEITFENNEKRIFDAKPYLAKGIFSELLNTQLFNTVHVSFDTIEWENGADLDPEMLYEQSVSETAESTARSAKT
jgi:hypothetical protein